MNTLGGALEFEFDIRLERFERQLSNIEGQLRTMTNQVETQTSRIDDAYKSLAAGIAAYFTIDSLKSFGQQLIEVRGEFKLLATSLETMLKSKAKADALMADIVKLSATTPFTLQEVGGGAKQLLAYGESADTVIGTLSRLGDVAAGTGTDITGIITAYGQVMTKGKLQGEEMNQFAERGVPIITELAKVLGVSKNQVSKIVESGSVGFDKLRQVMVNLTSETGLFGGMMEKQSKTIPGQISNMKDAWAQMLNALGKSSEGYISGVVSGITKMIGSFTKMVEISPIKQMEEEGTKVNMLASGLLEANVPYETRVRLLGELKDIAPDIVKGLDAENLNYVALKKNLEAYNLQLANKIILERQQEKIVTQAESEASAKEKMLKDQEDLRRAITVEANWNKKVWQDYKKEVDKISKDVNLTIYEKVDEISAASLRMRKINTDEQLSVLASNLKVSTAKFENEQAKTKALINARKKLVSDLGIVEPESKKDSGDGEEKQTLGLLEELNKKLKELKDSREKATSPGTIANIDKETEAVQKQISVLEAKIKRLKDIRDFGNTPLTPVVNTNLDKPIAFEKNDVKNQYQLTIAPLQPTQYDLDTYVKEKDSVQKWAVEQETQRQKQLSENIDKLNRDELKNKLAALQKELYVEETLGRNVIKIRQQVANVMSKLSDDAYNNAMDVSDAIGKLASTIGGEFGEVIGQSVSGFQSMYSGIKNINAEGATFGQQFMGAAGMFTTAIGIMQQVGGELDLLGNKKTEEDNKKYYESQKQYISNVTKLIELQTEALRELKGEEKITSRNTVLTQLQADAENIQKQALRNVRIFTQTRVEAKKILGITVGVNISKEYADLSKASFEELKQIRDDYLAGKAKNKYGVLQSEDFTVLDDYINKYEETLRQIRDIQNSKNAELTGSTYDSILTGIVDAFDDGTLSVDEFADNFDSIMKKSIMNAFSRQLLEKQLEGWYDEFAKASESGGQLTSSEISDLKTSLQTITDNAQTGLKTLVETAGIDLASTTGETTSSMTGAIKNIQEETANVLAGQTNAIRISIVEQTAIAMQGLNNLIAIEYNTRLTASNTGRIVELMTSSNSSDINNNRANGI